MTATNIVLVGARSTRQGTGPFLAAGLAAAGADIGGIVGTSEESVTEARQSLRDSSGITCRGYTDLAQAIEVERPEAVVLCSPWRFHREQLTAVAAQGCHCLVEKPLLWPATDGEADELISAFEKRNLLLQVVAQWPYTLPGFAALHGDIPAEVHSFNMRLSPISIGPDMVTDSAPHFIAMLQALAGPGDFEDVVIDRHSSTALAVAGRYRHRQGRVDAALFLETSAERPRPAWYQINERRVDREVELPEYRQCFTAGSARTELPDPMHAVAKAFLDKLAESAATDGTTLRRGHRNLLQLAGAWPH